MPRAKSDLPATTIDLVLQPTLPERTLAKLEDRVAISLDPTDRAEAISILLESFREAHCDASLLSVTFWDLSGASRILGHTIDGQEITIPYAALPRIGTIISHANRTYYITSHKEPS